MYDRVTLAEALEAIETKEKYERLLTNIEQLEATLRKESAEAHSVGSTQANGSSREWFYGRAGGFDSVVYRLDKIMKGLT